MFCHFQGNTSGSSPIISPGRPPLILKSPGNLDGKKMPLETDVTPMDVADLTRGCWCYVCRVHMCSERDDNYTWDVNKQWSVKSNAF